MKISIGNDHAGTEYKFAILKHLEAKGYTVINHGTDSNASVDYADFVHPVAEDVASKKSDCGILLCGSANGVAMTANNSENDRELFLSKGMDHYLSKPFNVSDLVKLLNRIYRQLENKNI